MAYISSIALLTLAALQPPSPEKVGDNATYFDSVIFLTMFLLAGGSSCSLLVFLVA
jgi:Cu+-exporting ATPase